MNSINLKENIDEHIQNNPKPGENQYQPMDFKNFKKKSTNQSLLPNVCYFQKENNTLRYGFKIFRNL
jgi:hypothetical protein